MTLAVALSGFFLPGLAGSAGPGATMTKIDTPAAGKLVVIGASYAKGWTPGTLAGLRVVNRGAGGEQTHEVLARFDRDVIAEAPRAVIIWGFINDIFRSGDRGIDATLAASRRNLAAMIDKAAAAGIAPIVATEVTVTGPAGLVQRLKGFAGRLLGRKSYQDYVNRHVRETNEWLRRLAAERKLVVLDLETLLAEANGERKREYATEDGSHLTPQAYDAITRYAEGMKLPI
jgi:lysophospholipase L1-like esterase